MIIRRQFAALLLLAAPAAFAQDPEPYIEVGVGGIGLYLPDYRGSDHYNIRGYPFPYLIYRSQRVRVTRDGIRASLFTHTDVTLSLSMAASLPGSRSSAAREGMPELMPTFEAGPSIDVRLAGQRDEAFHAQLRLPVRAVLATDLGDFEAAGWLFNPHVRTDWRTRVGAWEAGSNLGAGPLWATRRYHDYFYGVDPEFDDGAGRPAYPASGGYSGFRVGLSSVVRKDRLRYGAFASYDWLKGVSFRDSPLFRSEHALLAGIYVSYSLWSSGSPVSVETGD